jgi:hypothetical protein
MERIFWAVWRRTGLWGGWDRLFVVLGLAIALHSDVAIERIEQNTQARDPPVTSVIIVMREPNPPKVLKAQYGHVHIAKSHTNRRPSKSDNIAEVLYAEQHSALVSGQR